MNNKILIGTVIGLIVGLVLGVFIGVLSISPSGILPIKAGAGSNNQVQVSGTVPNLTTGTLCFRNLNQTIETTTPITNGEYSVLLIGGQSYNIWYNFIPKSGDEHTSNYNTFYLPLGITTFTENLVIY